MKLNNINDVAEAESILTMYKCDVKSILDSYKNIASLQMNNKNVVSIKNRILADIGELYDIYNKSYFTE